MPLTLLPLDKFQVLVDQLYSTYQQHGLERLGDGYTREMDDTLRLLAFLDARSIEHEVTAQPQTRRKAKVS